MADASVPPPPGLAHTKEHRAAALRRERAGYAVRGLDNRVEAVDEELRRLDQDPTKVVVGRGKGPSQTA